MTVPRVRHATLQPRQILGVSLPPDIAAAIKAEAARRSITTRTLVLEMWGSYKAKSKLP